MALYSDIEMGDTTFEDHVPLAKDMQPMRIHVSQGFMHQERRKRLGCLASFDRIVQRLWIITLSLVRLYFQQFGHYT